MVLAATNEFNYDPTKNHACVVVFSRNIPTVVGIVCKGEDFKCMLLIPLIGIIASIYIFNFCCGGGGRCEFVDGSVIVHRH